MNCHPFVDFTEILTRRHIEPGQSRLLRHSDRGGDQWRRGRDSFGHFASYQSQTPSPYKDCRYAFQFIPERPLDDGDQTALFVGATCVAAGWRYDGRRLARMSTDAARRNSDYMPKKGETAYDLKWLPEFDDLVERVVVRWGPRASTRAWSQWANKRHKEVVELRRDAAEPSFPGFATFVTTFDDIPLLPPSWRAVLAAVKGVYLLVHPSGDQYVGSAAGEQGFLGRFLEYAANGHGGNQLLQKQPRANYTVSILEATSSSMSGAEIIRHESEWKRKLGSRAHGLNAN